MLKPKRRIDFFDVGFETRSMPPQTNIAPSTIALTP